MDESDRKSKLLAGKDAVSYTKSAVNKIIIDYMKAHESLTEHFVCDTMTSLFIMFMVDLLSTAASISEEKGQEIKEEEARC